MNNSKKYYFIRDGLNSVRMIVDGMGRVIKKIDYDPFGEIKCDSKDIRFAFTGREYDPESGLYFYRARYYHPEVGRFISKDPIGLKGGINPYIYVKNNPINFVDPLGLSEEERILQYIISEIFGDNFESDFNDMTGNPEELMDAMIDFSESLVELSELGEEFVFQYNFLIDPYSSGVITIMEIVNSGSETLSDSLIDLFFKVAIKIYCLFEEG